MQEPLPFINPNITIELLNNTIKEVRRELISRDKEALFTADQMREMLEIERNNKNRSTLIRWFEFGIKQGKLPTEFFLGYREKVSILKSALQKYIRRAETEKALGVGKLLFLLARVPAVNRLKIMVVEDVASVVGITQHLNTETDFPKFLACVKVIADAPKDGRYGAVANRLENLTDKQLSQLSIDIENGVVARLFLLGEDKNEDEIYRIIGRTPVTESLIQRAVKGTYFKGDRFCLYAAALDCSKPFISDIKLPRIKFNEIKPIKFGEIDWYCLDFHTPVGRTALNFFISKHREVNRAEFETAWFMGESAKLGGKILYEFEMGYDKELWEKHKDEIKDLVIYCKEHIYRLHDY